MSLTLGQQSSEVVVNCEILELKLSHEMLEVENNRLIIQMESRQKGVQKLEEETTSYEPC
ncbi:hypothetical protein [Paenisporosarcina sp. TG20]|uniref:hypothetical protein n=1 Tax=Paenisporosarcina sp. TG20 TaxID=1211706 RepID=UPI0002E5A1D0|nr:hypothetical protein [Paenisporosarcina sp. TG20]